ncbi:MAG TPA: 50S ribosomal protein L19e [Candidatus Nanoarchaeia archaeon]|nr:50S ribosomal protein L19e [Candidatus Nanoarchaeia archaeon]
MNLRKKKELTSRMTGVGKGRIVFVTSRLEEIKEAITKQDIRDLIKEKAIIIKNIKGRRSSKKKIHRSTGNIRKKVKNRKRNYVLLTRKLRGIITELKKQGKISKEEVEEIRKKIRNKLFKSKAHLKEYLKEIEK